MNWVKSTFRIGDRKPSRVQPIWNEISVGYLCRDGCLKCFHSEFYGESALGKGAVLAFAGGVLPVLTNGAYVGSGTGSSRQKIAATFGLDCSGVRKSDTGG